MRCRAISRTSVESTLKHPDFSFTIRLGRFAALKRYGNKFLKVVYEK